MAVTQGPQTDVNDFVHTGPERLREIFRQFWLAIFQSRDLGPEWSKPVRILGETLTLFRGSSGQVFWSETDAPIAARSFRPALSTVRESAASITAGSMTAWDDASIAFRALFLCGSGPDQRLSVPGISRSHLRLHGGGRTAADAALSSFRGRRRFVFTPVDPSVQLFPEPGEFDRRSSHRLPACKLRPYQEYRRGRADHIDRREPSMACAIWSADQGDHARHLLPSADDDELGAAGNVSARKPHGVTCWAFASPSTTAATSRTRCESFVSKVPTTSAQAFWNAERRSGMNWRSCGQPTKIADDVLAGGCASRDIPYRGNERGHDAHTGSHCADRAGHDHRSNVAKHWGRPTSRSELLRDIWRTGNDGIARRHASQAIGEYRSPATRCDIETVLPNTLTSNPKARRPTPWRSRCRRR